MILAVLRKLHAWAGLFLCLLVVPLALSGAALVFKPQVLRATVPGAAEIVPITPAVAARAMTAAAAQLPTVRSVIFAGPEIGLHQANLADGGAAYLRPDGAVVQVWEKNGRVFDWLFDFHHHLLSGETGSTVAGWAGVMLLLLIVSGIIVWLPARRSFAGRIAPAGTKRGAWLSAHRDLGLMAAPFIALMVLTGSAVQLSEVSARLMGFERVKPPKAAAAEVDWPTALAAAQARFPDAQLRIATLPAKDGDPAVVRLRQPAEWHANGRTSVYIDPASSQVIGIDDALAQPLGAGIYNALWPIHASKVGGIVWKIATFLTGLALAALALYGAESYRRKLFASLRTPAARAAAVREG